MKPKFLKCEHCGNIVTFVEDKGVPIVCCGQKMIELVPGAIEAAVEKHTPEIKKEGSKVTVTVSSVIHPMLEEHHIAWVALETKQGLQIKYLKPNEKPEVVFALAEGDEVVSAYEYCNLHGLWKA